MFELRLICPEDRVEALGDALSALDAIAVSVEDADAQTDAEQALFGEPGMPPPKGGWARSRMQALFADEAAASEAATLLAAQDFFADCALLGLSAIPDQDWVRLTQSQFAPVEITPSFWIVPSWHQAPAAAAQIIHLDPGLAFGTGTHPTTRMCLRWIATHSMRQTRVLDYGCGSGILAIAAAKFGAGDIDAVDIDPAAVTATQNNAKANQVRLNAGAPEQCHGQYQVVLANILATPLKLLAPLLCTHVVADGWLVLSGILERQQDELKAAYTPYARLQVVEQEDGWVLMAAKMAA